MIEQDTIRLLRACDAGIGMGTASIGEVLPSVRSDRLKELLTICKEEHEKLGTEIAKLLAGYKDEEREPGPAAKGMSRLKIGAKLLIHESDQTIADLMTDGCNTGVKLLNRSLNAYKAADETSKGIAKRLIRLEEKLAEDIRPFL